VWCLSVGGYGFGTEKLATFSGVDSGWRGQWISGGAFENAIRPLSRTATRASKGGRRGGWRVAGVPVRRPGVERCAGVNDTSGQSRQWGHRGSQMWKGRKRKAGLGLGPDPADPADWIRRIRPDIETAGPEPGARTPARVQKRPK